MIYYNDTIKTLTKNNTSVTKYRASCDNCGHDRGYISKQSALKSKKCIKCAHKEVSEETRLKMSIARQKRAPWNKGKKGISEETRLKMSEKKKGIPPWNKDKSSPLETRIKLSCINQGIDVEDFSGFTTDVMKAERNKFGDLGLHLQCFDKYNYTCDACGISKVNLNSHHKNSWKHFPDQRFNIDNLVCVCATCHKEFHKIYGNGKKSANTEDQYIDFKQTKNKERNRKTILLVCGAAGAGKSWICNQISDLAYYHEYDKSDRKNIRSAIWNIDGDVIICDIYSHISTFIKRNSDIFDIELYVINEDESVIIERLTGRGGQITDSVRRRIARMKKLSKRAIFNGTSNEVLEKLKTRLTGVSAASH